VRHSTSHLRSPGSIIKRWPGHRSRPWVQRFLSAATSERSIVSIVAIGSAIRPRGHARSDLDLLVIYAGDKPRLHPPVGVDVRTYPASEIETRIASGHEILGWSARFGVALYDPDALWMTIQRRWIDRVPLPDAMEAARRARDCIQTMDELLSNGDESAASDLALAAITQIARFVLIQNKVFPASRPELPKQLRAIRKRQLAQILDDSLVNDTKTDVLRIRIRRAYLNNIASGDFPVRISRHASPAGA
jgi:hypothetical protein